MTTFPDFKYFCGVLACAAALTGCSTTVPVKPAGPLPLSELLSQGSQHAATGQKEKAISVWKEASAAYPGDKTPWANIAQSRYESGQYGEAITNAQEVLLRDPNDKSANAIIAVAGLRLANRSLGDLSRQSGLTPQLRADTADQFKQLREFMPDGPGQGTRIVRTAPAPTRANTGKKDAADDSPLSILQSTPAAAVKPAAPPPKARENAADPFNLLNSLNKK